ncbi:MAG: type II toxin-antitoxin system Phd/YefM family antitoxin [Actinobacteria bacterium]|nr:type II toxin-antitoxin system Phd/YefM family antitoxin [Actinomycetota bacterium]
MARYSASEACANFNRVLEIAKTEAVEIHKHGKPSVVVLDAVKYEKLMDYIEDLEDINTVLNYELDPESFGPSIPLEEVERELGLKPLRS